MSLTFPLSPLRLAVLISGGGTTLQNLLTKIDAGELDARVVTVVSSNPAARGLDFARAASVPTVVVERRDYPTVAAFSEAVFGHVRAAEPHLVAMGGFLKLVDIPRDFQNQVMNIHPALIPAFCGRGYYGHHVHQAVLDYGGKITGCTVHFVDHEYDHGPIILQATVPVRDDDTAETLAKRVFEAECELYTRAIRLFAEGKLRVEGRRVRIMDD
jgi:phosphoribosylglycinamide formyltransferase 1